MRNAIPLLLLAISAAFTAFAGKPTSYPAESLTVTVPSSGVDVVSDGLGPYVDGEKGVCASLSTTGLLNVNFDCASSSTPRNLFLYPSTNYAPPTGDTSYGCTPPSSITPTSYPGYTNHLGTGNTTAFQAMTIDSTGNTTYNVQIFIASKLSSTLAYRLVYHGTDWSAFSDAALASYAVVQRTSATHWIVTSVSPSTAMVVEDATTNRKSTTTECGFFTVPFSFTLDVN